MLWNASSIMSHTMSARDGTIGSVNDLLFDAATLKVRWLAADTGAWLPGRKVVLPVSVLGAPNFENKEFPVALTRQQIRESPDIDAHRPMSREAEETVYNHYGWDPYWAAAAFPVGVAPPPAPVPLQEAPPAEMGLLSVADLSGSDVMATDGVIGRASDFLVDDASWQVRYILIDTGEWWPGEKILVSPRSIAATSAADRTLTLSLSRERIKGAPRYTPDMTVDNDYDEKFLTYYGIKFTDK